MERTDHAATMPLELVFVRHGQSEANVVQQAEKNDQLHPQSDEVYARHDSMQRLSGTGRQQAIIAGKWLADDGLAPSTFDERYVSPFYRTLETASLLEPGAVWLPDAKIIERDWGLFGAVPANGRTGAYPDIERWKQQTTFFAGLAGGESIFDATFRVRDFLTTLARDMTGKRIIAVTHGEFMWATRFVIERLLPGEWETMDKDHSLRLGNCTVLHYTRRDPNGTGETVRSLSAGWRRIINPIEPARSPHCGTWVKLDGKRRLTSIEISSAIEKCPPLL